MSSAKYDMRLNPVYQVDYSASTKGKRFSLTKRNVRFSYGFSNADALANGLKGIHCRGEEHEVILVWSLTSGKRVVSADGAEVHFSRGKRTELKFECSWTTKGNHVMKLVAHATRFGNGENPNFRQFDLFLDGLSFFNMPKIFELGVVASNDILKRGSKATMAFAAPRSLIHDHVAQTVNDRAIHRNQFGYIPDNGTYGEQGNKRQQSHQEPRPPESAPPKPLPQPAAAQDFLSFTGPVNVDQPLLPASAPLVDEFAPVQPPPRTYNDVSHQILKAYGPAPTAPALLALPYEPHTYYTPAPLAQHVPTNAAAPQQSMYMGSSGSVDSGTNPLSGAFFFSAKDASFENELTTSESSPTSVRQLSALEKAMGSLVNIDDISAPAFSASTLSMEKEKASKKMNDGKSRPLPPATSWNVGSQAPLSAIKASAQRSAPTREVMRASASQTGTGGNMLVVYGATPREAPPLVPVYHPLGRASFAH